MLAHGLVDGETTTPLPVTNGIKQRCVLAANLFGLMFYAMLADALQHEYSAIGIIHNKYRTSGKLFNPRRLQAKTKVSITMFRASLKLECRTEFIILKF